MYFNKYGHIQLLLLNDFPERSPTVHAASCRNQTAVEVHTLSCRPEADSLRMDFSGGVSPSSCVPLMGPRPLHTAPRAAAAVPATPGDGEASSALPQRPRFTVSWTR